MPKREPILDDPETLKMVKDEFAKQCPGAASSLDDPSDPQFVAARLVWDAFRAGFEYGYWLEEIPLHSG